MEEEKNDNIEPVQLVLSNSGNIAENLPPTQQIAILAAEPKKISNPTRINKLVMHGFKSFAKHTEIILPSNFNCVLGPNGAGKSNVLDALCFVLGKSSSRELRAEKSANLI